MTDSKAKTVVKQIQLSRLTHVQLFMATYETEILLQEAFRQGVVGSGRHVWTFRDLPRTTGGNVIRTEYAPDDPLLLSLQGALRLEPVNGAPGIARYDSFVDAWKEIGTSEEDMAYLKSKLPKYPDDPTYRPILDASTFELSLIHI